MDVFLPKPFASPTNLENLFDPASLRGAIGNAVLADHLLTRDPDGVALALVAFKGAATEGVLLQMVEASAFERPNYVMGAFRSEGATVLTNAEGSFRPATTWLREPFEALEQPVDLTDWSPDDQALLDEVVQELVSYDQCRPRETLPGLLHGVTFRAIARVRGAHTRTPTEVRGGAAGEKDVERLDLRSGYANYFAVEEHRYRHLRFDGSKSEALDRTILASGDAVTVLPYDPACAKVLVIEQIRPAPLARRDPSPWLIEPIAGRCDRLEPPEETARREAREEAGVELGRFECISAYYSTPGIAAEYMTSFVAEADLSEAGGIYGLEEEGEDIRAIVLPLEDAMAAVATGEINVGPLILSLLWLNANRERLARSWGAESAA